MAFVECDGLKFFVFDHLTKAGIPHGIFTRHGGVSSGPYESLNIGGSNGDQRENVLENRRRLFESLGLPPLGYHDLWQVHSDTVYRVDEIRPQEQTQREGDGMITDRPGVGLLMRFGDCVPIMLYDPLERVIGMVHAGWMGTFQRIAEKAVRAMTYEYGSLPENILAGIGPSIGPDKFEISDDLADKFITQFPELNQRLLFKVGDKCHLDLWRLNALQLECSGVNNVEISNICTASNPQDWYSHRAEKGNTGRFGAVIIL